MKSRKPVVNPFAWDRIEGCTLIRCRQRMLVQLYPRIARTRISAVWSDNGTAPKFQSVRGCTNLAIIGKLLICQNITDIIRFKTFRSTSVCSGHTNAGI